MTITTEADSSKTQAMKTQARETQPSQTQLELELLKTQLQNALSSFEIEPEIFNKLFNVINIIINSKNTPKTAQNSGRQFADILHKHPQKNLICAHLQNFVKNKRPTTSRTNHNHR